MESPSVAFLGQVRITFSEKGSIEISTYKQYWDDEQDSLLKGISSPVF